MEDFFKYFELKKDEIQLNYWKLEKHREICPDIGSKNICTYQFSKRLEHRNIIKNRGTEMLDDFSKYFEFKKDEIRLKNLYFKKPRKNCPYIVSTNL